MSRVTELEKALTALFRKGTEVGYTETEIDEFLENIDYHALLQAVWNKRDIQLKFRVTPQEREMIETKMAQFGTTNMAAYLRKMAIDGYVVKLDLPELRELVSLLRYSSNNLNQLTRRAHETGRIYEADLEDIQQSQERIWTAAEKIVSSLAALK